MRPFTTSRENAESSSASSSNRGSTEGNDSISLNRSSVDPPASNPFGTPAGSRPESLNDNASNNIYSSSGMSTPRNQYGLFSNSVSSSRAHSIERSRRPSTQGARSGFQYGDIPGTGYFRSRRIVKGEAPPPTASKKHKTDKLLWIFPLGGLILGLCIAGVCIWYQLYFNVDHTNYCPVMDEDFSSGSVDSKWWNIEQEVGGYGNGEFEMTTADSANLFVKDSKLHIVPTLNDASLIETNNVINLTADGTCTSTVYSNCVVSTNTTNGTIVPPVRSARINTKGKASIKYGKIEVTAKLPIGDWLWPAIWMLPSDSVYGSWPASGEIDIMESRGNNQTYSLGGANFYSSALHWGPTTTTDSYKSTSEQRSSLHSLFGDSYRKFGLVWNQKYILTYVDNQLLQTYYYNWPKNGFWAKGNFQTTGVNGSTISNPWAASPNKNAPFDEEFYLIMNVAAGGTNGYFLDGSDGKPWLDKSDFAKSEFWQARNQWYPTWTKTNKAGDAQGQMIVDRVKMWKIC